MTQPKNLFPEDSEERKEYPIYSGLLQYFPSALAAVANHSYKGNKKHNPDSPDVLYHDRAKSQDEPDAMLRHLMEGDYVGMAWRAMAMLQKDLESKGAPIAPGTRNATPKAVEPYRNPFGEDFATRMEKEMERWVYFPGQYGSKKLPDGWVKGPRPGDYFEARRTDGSVARAMDPWEFNKLFGDPTK